MGQGVSVRNGGWGEEVLSWPAPAHLPHSVSVFTPRPLFQCLSSQVSVSLHLSYLPSSVSPCSPAPLTGLSFRPFPCRGSWQLFDARPSPRQRHRHRAERCKCPKDRSQGVRGLTAVRERRLSSPSSRETSLPSSPQRRNHLPSSLNSMVPAGCPSPLTPKPDCPRAKILFVLFDSVERELLKGSFSLHDARSHFSVISCTRMGCYVGECGVCGGLVVVGKMVPGRGSRYASDDSVSLSPPQSNCLRLCLHQVSGCLDQSE